MQKTSDLDRHNWLKIQQSLSSLCGFPLNIYDPVRQKPCTPVTNGNSVCLLVHEIGRESLCQQSYKKHVRLAIESQEILLFKCQARLSYFVIPIRLPNGTDYAIIGGRRYTSEADANAFRKEAIHWGISSMRLDESIEKNPVSTEDSLRRAAEDLQTIGAILIENVHQRNPYYSKSAYLSTLTNVAKQLKKDASTEMRYTTFLNTLGILYDLKSACVFQQLPRGAAHKCLFAFGENSRTLDQSEVLLDLLLEKEDWTDRTILVDKTPDLRKAGLPPGTSSCTLFPLSENSRQKITLAILDTSLCEEDTRIIASFCLQVGGILENITLLDQIEVQKKTINSLSDLTLVDSKLKNGALYTKLLEQATRLLGAEKGSLMVKGENGDGLSVKAMTGVNPTLFALFNKQLGEGVAGQVWQTGEALLVKDISKDERISNRPRPRYKTDSFVSVPLKMTDHNLGVVNVSDKKDGRSFTEEDLSLLQAVGSFMTIAIDRAHLQEKKEALREISITDSLTGLITRRYFQERLEKEVERTRRYGLPTCLVMIDIDDFKKINDGFGHPMGDQVLKGVAKVIADSLRTIDVASRYGGEEFTLILPHTGKEDARVISERVCSVIAEGRELRAYLPNGIGLTVSAGLASFPEDAATISELIQNADRALYQAKHLGKNRVAIYRRDYPDFLNQG